MRTRTQHLQLPRAVAVNGARLVLVVTGEGNPDWLPIGTSRWKATAFRIVHGAMARGPPSTATAGIAKLRLGRANHRPSATGMSSSAPFERVSAARPQQSPAAAA
jgi:hypothetical protein